MVSAHNRFEFSLYDVGCAALVLLSFVVTGVIIGFGLLMLIHPVSATTLIINASYNGVLNEWDPSGQTWASITTGNGDGTSSVASYMSAIYQGAGSSTFDVLYRPIIIFDTSSIPDTATINSAKVTVWSRGNSNNNGGANPNFTLVDAEPASTTIIASDFTKTNKVRQANDIPHAFCADGQMCNWTLSNLTWISKTGNTAYMLLVSFDKDAVTPNSIAGQESGFWISSLAYSGGSQKPFITIEYTTEPTPTVSVHNHCQNQTGNITLNLISNSTTSLSWQWSDPANVSKVAEDGLYIPLDNSSDSYVGVGYLPGSWHNLKIYNATDFGLLNCTTDSLPVIIPIMPSTEENANPVSILSYWWIGAIVIGVVMVFKKW